MFEVTFEMYLLYGETTLNLRGNNNPSFLILEGGLSMPISQTGFASFNDECSFKLQKKLTEPYVTYNNRILNIMYIIIIRLKFQDSHFNNSQYGLAHLH